MIYIQAAFAYSFQPVYIVTVAWYSGTAIIVYSWFSHFNLKLLRPPTFCANTFDKTARVCLVLGEKLCTAQSITISLQDKSTVTGVSCDTWTVCIGLSRCEGGVCVWMRVRLYLLYRENWHHLHLMGKKWI